MGLLHNNVTVVIVGPQGCGKSTNAQKLADAYCCNKVVDGWTWGQPLTRGALHLTNQQSFSATANLNAIVLNYADAIKAIN